MVVELRVHPLELGHGGDELLSKRLPQRPKREHLPLECLTG